jgi:hypothetical protein
MQAAPPGAAYCFGDAMWGSNVIRISSLIANTGTYAGTFGCGSFPAFGAGGYIHVNFDYDI